MQHIKHIFEYILGILVKGLLVIINIDHFENTVYEPVTVPLILELYNCSLLNKGQSSTNYIEIDQLYLFWLHFD